MLRVLNQKGGAEIELAIRACCKLPRQAGEIFPKLPGAGNQVTTASGDTGAQAENGEA